MKLIITSALAAMAMGAAAQEPVKIATDLDIALFNKYVWRGTNFVNDWVLQPSVSFSAKGLTLGLWGNFELTNWNGPNYTRSPKGRFTEFDASLEYGQAWADGSWRVGVVDYQFPGTGSERYAEWFAGMSFDNMKFSPSVTLYKGTRAAMGTYIEVEASHDFEMGKQALTLNGQLGYGDKKSNNFFYGSSRNALTHLQFDVSTSIAAVKGWDVAPSISYSTLLDRAHLAGQARRTNLWFGVNFKRSF